MLLILPRKGCYKMIINIHTYFSQASLELASETMFDEQGKQ